MKPLFLLSFFILSCALPQDRGPSFLQLAGLSTTDLIILPKNEMIPVNTPLLKYPYLDPAHPIPLNQLPDIRQPSFIFFLGKNYVSQCDICLFNQLTSIRQLAAAKKVPVVFLSDNRNSRGHGGVP